MNNTLKVPTELQEAIASDNLVIFVGAGLSKKFDLPTWNQLACEIITQSADEDMKLFLPLLAKNLTDPVEVIEKLRGDRNKLNKYIRDRFKIQSGDFSLHKKILDLSSKIITTNYDNAFEMASDNRIYPTLNSSTFNVSEINKNSKPYIFKLHGSYHEPDNCIVTKSDYQELYSKQSATIEKLKSIFIEKTILFIGFSFSDSDINLIFEGLDEVFRHNNKHYILTKEPEQFKKYTFLNTIEISSFENIEPFIDLCQKLKLESSTPVYEEKLKAKQATIPNIALLFPFPLDVEMDDFNRTQNCFDSINAIMKVGTLNIKTLALIDDFDLLIIMTKVYKNQVYIEEDNLKSSLINVTELREYIPNDDIPILLITNAPIEILPNNTLHISSYKTSVLSKFVYKATKGGDFTQQKDGMVSESFNFPVLFSKGTLKKVSIYGNDRDLEIGKKCLSNVIGRLEEQSSIAQRLLLCIRNNRLLNIKGSGGIGKTTLLKKVAYELYNRGYFKNGVYFKSCQSIKNYDDFEELLIEGFNLTNIINFKDYLIENYSTSKIDSLIILDNFETVVNSLSEEDKGKTIDLLMFATDYANIAVTSREEISKSESFEDVYSLSQMTTDDALILFEKDYGKITDSVQIKLLRTDILEELLNNNPLAIKLVTKSRTRYKNIADLKKQLAGNFFESTNEEFTSVFNSDADLNIERTKSIYQCINYSYCTLSSIEKLAFELLHLFPDGITLPDYKRCFEKKRAANQTRSVNLISEKELRKLRDKSLLEDYNGIIQLQPIIRRFAEYQFSKRSLQTRNRYCLDAYSYNCFILRTCFRIKRAKSYTESLKFFNSYKNNLTGVINYMKDIEIDKNGSVKSKVFLLNYIYELEEFIENNKQIDKFFDALELVKSYFLDVPDADIFIKTVKLYKQYMHREFDTSYKNMCEIFPAENINKRGDNEKEIEWKYKDTITHIHAMEGYTLNSLNYFLLNSRNGIANIGPYCYYLGIMDNVLHTKRGFYFFEHELMLGRLNIADLEIYISKLYEDEHLERMQCTYTLSKVKKLDEKTIKKLVITNPYTRGLKEMMYAFNSVSSENISKHFLKAIGYLQHIKYYYLEAIFYYCKFLKGIDNPEYNVFRNIGQELSSRFKYQYLQFLFEKVDNEVNEKYLFSYSYYQVDQLQKNVVAHNEKWIEEVNKVDYF